MALTRRATLTGTCLAIAAAGLASAALAQDRTLWLYTGDTTTVDGYFFYGEGIYGDCDADCFDLDLFLYDAVTGELVDQDVEPDAVPYVIAPWEGDFVIEVTMPDCDHPDGCAVWISSDEGF
jgi:hypothetical protein